MATPGGSGPIGPFPQGVSGEEAEEEYDRMRRRLLWSFPSGLYVIGSRHGERRNAMTANWVTQVSFDPKLMGVAVEHGALTHELIRDGEAFTVNTIARDDRAVVRKFTKPVDVDVTAMTLNGFGFRDGVSGTPILTMAVAYVDCAVRQAVEVGGHTLFVGEVLDCGFQDDEETAVLRMEDTRMNYGG
jgi:flavin reductase (DIM6/NTAB) family NADH-FMN oxidoreductase RutF